MSVQIKLSDAEVLGEEQCQKASFGTIREQRIAVEFLRLVNATTGLRDLIQMTTAFLKEQSGCDAVGIRLRDGDDYPYYETRGFPQDFVLAENSLCSRHENGNPQYDGNCNSVLECMCGNVIHGRFDCSKPFFTPAGSFWTDCTTDLLANTTDADRQARTRNRCNGEGYESVALIRLHSGNESLGLLQLNDHRKGIFTEEIIAFWERLAGFFAVAVAKARAEKKLIENEELFRLIASCTPDHLLVQNRDLRYSMVVNPQLGLTERDMIGKTDHDFLSQEDADKLVKVKRQVMETGKSVRVELPLTSTKGDQEFFEGSYVPKFDSEGRVDGLIGYFKNITDRKKVDEALRSSEHFVQAILRGTPSLFYIYDLLEHRNVYANQSVLDFLGYTPEEILTIGSALFQTVLHPDDADRVAQHHARIVMAGDDEVLEIEYRMKCRNGQWRWLRSRDVVFARNEQGFARQILGSADDITQRKQAEERVLASEATLREAQELASLGSYVVDIPQGCWTSSEVLDRIFDISSDYGRTVEGWGNLVHPDERQAMLDYFHDEVIGNHKPFDREYRIVRNGDNQVRWVHGLGRLEFDAAGHPTAMLGTIQDITERKQAEEALRISESRYRLLFEDLKQAQEILRQARDEELQRHQAEMAHVARLSMMGEMAASMAHELNQPLHAVKNYAYGSICRLQKIPARDEEIVVALEQIGQEANRAAEIIHRIMGFVRKREPCFSEVVMNGLVKEAILFSKAELGRRRAKVVVELAEDLPAVLGDAIQIEQVVVNLIRNGLESMDETPEENRLLGIKIVRHGDEMVRVEVCDRGKGIGEEDLKKVFEPFFTTKPDGMGLGLAIGRSIVQSHHGRIWVSNNQDRGCTFHFTLPVCKRS